MNRVCERIVLCCLFTFVLFGAYCLLTFKPVPVAEAPAELPMGIEPILIGPHFKKTISCPLCDKQAKIFSIRKEYKDQWKFGYYCGAHFSYFDENYHLQTASP